MSLTSMALLGALSAGLSGQDLLAPARASGFDLPEGEAPDRHFELSAKARRRQELRRRQRNAPAQKFRRAKP